LRSKQAARQNSRTFFNIASLHGSCRRDHTNAAVGFENAFQSAVQEYAASGKVFSPQNWLKSKDSLTKTQASISMLINMLQNMPGGAALKATLTLKPEVFGLRWASD